MCKTLFFPFHSIQSASFFCAIQFSFHGSARLAATNGVKMRTTQIDSSPLTNYNMTTLAYMRHDYFSEKQKPFFIRLGCGWAFVWCRHCKCGDTSNGGPQKWRMPFDEKPFATTVHTTCYLVCSVLFGANTSIPLTLYAVRVCYKIQSAILHRANFERVIVIIYVGCAFVFILQHLTRISIAGHCYTYKY